MTLPQVVAETVDASVVYDASIATDQHFIIGLTAKGPTTPQRDFSLKQWVARWGGRVATSSMYDDARVFFAEAGPGAAIVTQRVLGPAPVLASSTASNSVPATVIKLSALSYGAYGNSITRQFVAGVGGGTVQLILTDENGVVQHSPDLATQAAIIAWAAATGIATATALSGSGLPVVDSAPVAFTGGTDDSTHAVDANFTAGLDGINDQRLGPGQVSMPGRTTDVAHLAIQAHCDRTIGADRIALLDFADTSSAGTITGNASDLHTSPGAAASAGCAPWVITPDGVQVPGSAFIAAVIARSDLASGNPNQPAAGDNGQAAWTAGLTQDWNAADREQLNDAGIDVIRDVDAQGTLQLFGYRTLTDPVADPLNVALSNVRLDMLIRWKARALAAPLLFQEIDSKGRLASRYNGLITGMLQDMVTEGAVYGFSVDTTSVNSATTAAAGQLNARIGIQRSEFAEQVFFEVTNYAVNQPIGS